jgi:hypothetical protein
MPSFLSGSFQLWSAHFFDIASPRLPTNTWSRPSSRDGKSLTRFSHSSKKNGDTVSIEMRVRRSEAPRRTVSMPSLVLGSALAFFLRRSLQQLGLRAALRHGLIASLWRARLSIAPTREKFGLSTLTRFSSIGIIRSLFAVFVPAVEPMFRDFAIDTVPESRSTSCQVNANVSDGLMPVWNCQ